MNDFILHINADRIVLGQLEGQEINNLEKVERGNQHPLLWIRETLSEREIGTVTAAAEGLVSGGIIRSRSLGEIDFFDLMATQFDAPALLLPEGQATALAESAEEPLLAAYLGQELSFGFWNGEEIETGSRGAAGYSSRPIGGELLEEVYESQSGTFRPWREIITEKDPAAEEARFLLLETLIETLSLAASLYDPARIVLAGGALLSYLAEAFLRTWPASEQAPLQISGLGDLAPLLGAAKMISADPCLG